MPRSCWRTLPLSATEAERGAGEKLYSGSDRNRHSLCIPLHFTSM